MIKKAMVMLKFGSAAWNRWRSENPGFAISLDGAKLDGMILTGFNFAHVSLRAQRASASLAEAFGGGGSRTLRAAGNL
jgi:hypothetical protein